MGWWSTMGSAGMTHLSFRWSLILWHVSLGFFKWHYRGPKRTDWGFPHASVVKTLPANAGDVGLIPGSGRSPGEEKGNPLWYSCLGNLMDRGTFWTIVYGVTKESDMT